MGHFIQAFLYRGELDTALAERFPPGALCALTQGVIALTLPCSFGDDEDDEDDEDDDDDDALKRELLNTLANERREGAAELAQPHAFTYLNHVKLSLAARLADERAFAYIETNYFGGAGDQNAAMWCAGRLCLPSSATARPVLINEVLKSMGVTVSAGVHDEFEAIGLHVMRTNDHFEEGLEARLHRMIGLGARGRYVGPSGVLELRMHNERIGRWDPERARWIPWRVTVAESLLDSETGYTYTLEHERTGTPGLRRRGDAPARFYYNDGPSLVHDPTRAGWRRHVGEYRADHGARVSIRMDKKQLYLDETRLLPVSREQPTRPNLRAHDELLADDRFVTGRLEPVEFTNDTLLLQGARYRRA